MSQVGNSKLDEFPFGYGFIILQKSFEGIGYTIILLHLLNRPVSELPYSNYGQMTMFRSEDEIENVNRALGFMIQLAKPSSSNE